MPAVSRGDAERLLRFVAEAGSVGGKQPFTEDLLVELGRLIEADWVTYSEVDHVRRRSLLYLPRPGDDDEGGDIDDDGWELMHEHPICQRWREDGQFSALRLSDVIAQREFRRSRYYAECFKPWGIEYELKVRLASPPWHRKTFMFNRKRGRDFTNRDRLVLELLTPHFTRLWQAARTRRLLASALTQLDGAPEENSAGVVLLGVAGDVEFASAPARRMLREFFGANGGTLLPREVGRWAETGSDPLVQRRGRRELTVERSDGALLLRERWVEADLTPREREILAWVARGKTNAEIARLLWLAPSTVRKHLENVYAKLGVNTRTAAVARFLGIIEAEAS